uniref:Plastid ribosomal protein L26 n=1 Tax=Eustigmatophyceae sp. Mont 10/10-1w TaxID=2506145 RepID=A0A451FLF9_9STRA|nr:plastid ribosomal protein L26 [Eustigmatophyceae sp. Mont 10/10-1w]
MAVRRGFLALVALGAVGLCAAFLPPSLKIASRGLVVPEEGRACAARIEMMAHRNDQLKRRRTSFLRYLRAPIHKRRSIMSSPLAKDLREQYGGVRAMPIRTGDEVVVTAGDHKKKTGKIVGVDRRKYYVHVEGITREKAGAKEAGKTSTTIPVPIRASKVKITKLYLDSSREAILKRRQEGRAAAAARKDARSKGSSDSPDPMWDEYQAELQRILKGEV